MFVQKLRNLISLRTRNLSRRVQRALEELSEALSNEGGSVQPKSIPVPVPIRNNGRKFARSHCTRYYSTIAKFQSGFGCPGFRFCSLNSPQFKFYHCSTNFAQGPKIFNNLGKGFMSKTLSQVYSSTYRTKVFQRNVKLTYRTLLGMTNMKFDSHNKSTNRFNPLIRLNVSLSPEHHKITLEMARTDSSASYEEKLAANQVMNGCFIEFPINLNLDVPNQTLFNEDVLNAMVADLTIVQGRIEELKRDLTKLFDLGEVPIEYVASKQVIRAYFPNCDKSKLETLCQEHGIVGGIVYEDLASSAYVSHESISSDSENVNSEDILSSSFGDGESITPVSSMSSCSDVLSSFDIQPLSSSEIIRIEDGSEPIDSQEVSIIQSDEYYWGSV